MQQAGSTSAAKNVNKLKPFFFEMDNLKINIQQGTVGRFIELDKNSETC